MTIRRIFLIGCIMFSCSVLAQESIVITAVDSGWAHNSVNTVVFRKNSLATYQNNQYIAFYDKQQNVIIGKRKSGATKWELKQTGYKGNAADAHNSISIMVDGSGFLHMAWDHHGNALNYCKSKAPGSLELSEKLPMTGYNELNVTYPEFHKMPNGNLLFLYRDGQSGKGNLVLNRYDVQSKEWTQLHSSLIDGEGQRNPYWQACIDTRGVVHLSWVWRESADVSSNHDMCYASSSDGGKTWCASSGKTFPLPITAATAEYANRIPQKSELINQTSMFADAMSNPYIVSYWREKNDSVPQYHLLCKKGTDWKVYNLSFRKSAFSLSGAGTKRIPISRPQVIAWQSAGRISVAVIFRDAERGNKVSVAICKNMENVKWEVVDIYNESVGSWEPSYDTELWKEKNILHLFVQKTEQADAEGMANMPQQMIKVLSWKPVFK